MIGYDFYLWYLRDIQYYKNMGSLFILKKELGGDNLKWFERLDQIFCILLRQRTKRKP